MIHNSVVIQPKHDQSQSMSTACSTTSGQGLQIRGRKNARVREHEELIASIKENVIGPAEEKVKELRQRN
jgi:hypothetical protein